MLFSRHLTYCLNLCCQTQTSCIERPLSALIQVMTTSLIKQVSLPHIVVSSSVSLSMRCCNRALTHTVPCQGELPLCENSLTQGERNVKRTFKHDMVIISCIPSLLKVARKLDKIFLDLDQASKERTGDKVWTFEFFFSPKKLQVGKRLSSAFTNKYSQSFLSEQHFIANQLNI